MEESMNRSSIVMIAAVTALAACAQRPAATTTPVSQPQTSSTGSGRGDGDGRGAMRGEGRQRMEAMLFNGITLSTDQQTRIDSIRARYRADAQKLDPRNNPDDRQKMMQSMQSQMADIRAVLTADQQTIFDQNVQQMRDRRAQRDGGGPPRD
jgi:Spy/CpxP family protein refolding chaperone